MSSFFTVFYLFHQFLNLLFNTPINRLIEEALRNVAYMGEFIESQQFIILYALVRCTPRKNLILEYFDL